MVTRSIVASGLATGLALGCAPAAWAINTQLGLILPDLACGEGRALPAVISFGLTLLAVGLSAVSWRAVNPAETAQASTLAFGARLGALMAAAFAFVLALQGISSMMLTGCEH